MTADEILKALEESEGFYLEVNGWVVAKDEEPIDPKEPWIAQRYVDMKPLSPVSFLSLKDAMAWAAQETKP